jgi:6-pyruvoyl-tetrahydropterin synthase
MDNNIYIKEFEFPYKKNFLIKDIDKFLNEVDKEFKHKFLISIEENIFFNPKKEKICRIIIYYQLINIKLNTYNIFKLNIINEKREINKSLDIINKFIDNNIENKEIILKLINISSNHFIEDKTLMIRTTYFFFKMINIK